MAAALSLWHDFPLHEHGPLENKRLYARLAQWRRDQPHLYDLVRAAPTSDLSVWRAVARGPADTPFAGGLYAFELHFPSDYPMTTPRVCFTPPLWHPNVDARTGVVHANMLSPRGWTPAISRHETLLLSLIALLADASEFPAANLEAARLMRDDYTEYERALRKRALESGQALVGTALTAQALWDELGRLVQSNVVVIE